MFNKHVFINNDKGEKISTKKKRNKETERELKRVLLTPAAKTSLKKEQDVTFLSSFRKTKEDYGS